MDAAERIISTSPVHPFSTSPQCAAHSLQRSSQLRVCQQKEFCSCLALLKSPAVPLADLLPQGPSGNLCHQMPDWRVRTRTEKSHFAWKKGRTEFLSSFYERVLHVVYKILTCQARLIAWLLHLFHYNK